MTTPTSWRDASSPRAAAPSRFPHQRGAGRSYLVEDHAALNHVFSEAFTERYRRDGLVGVRVPFLNPAIWRYAIEDANGGALIWRDEREDIAAFNIVHCSGREGWMGPLAVRPDAQGAGLGKEVVRSGIDWLTARAGRRQPKSLRTASGSGTDFCCR